MIALLWILLSFGEDFILLIEILYELFAFSWLFSALVSLITRSLKPTPIPVWSKNLVLIDDEDYINVDEEVVKPVPQYDPQYARRVSKQ